MIHFAPVMLFFPLVGFLVLVTFGRRMGEKVSGMIATTAIGLSFVAALITFIGLLGQSNREVTQHLYSWLAVGPLHVDIALLIDPLSITMCLFITFICLDPLVFNGVHAW